MFQYSTDSAVVIARIQPDENWRVWTCLQATLAPLLTQLPAGFGCYPAAGRCMRPMLFRVPLLFPAIIWICWPVQNQNVWTRSKNSP